MGWLVGLCCFFGCDDLLVLNYVALLKVHAVVDGFELIVDLVKLVHEHVRLALLILLLPLLGRDSILKPLLLLLEVLYLDLLLEELDLLLLPQTLDEDLTFSEGPTFF